MVLFPNRIRIFNKYLQKLETATLSITFTNEAIYIGDETGTKYVINLQEAWRKAISGWRTR